MKRVTVPVVASLLALSAFGFHQEPHTIKVQTVDSSTVASYVPTIPVVPAPVGELIPPLTLTRNAPTAPVYSAPTLGTETTLPSAGTLAYEPDAPGITDTPGNIADNPAIMLDCEIYNDGPDTHAGNGKPGWYPVVIASDVATLNLSIVRNCEVHQ